MITKKSAVLAFAAAIATAGASEAETVRFDLFDPSSNGSWVDSLEFTVGDITLEVTADPGWEGHGLGVNGGDGDGLHQIDSYGYDEVFFLGLPSLTFRKTMIGRCGGLAKRSESAGPRISTQKSPIEWGLDRWPTVRPTPANQSPKFHSECRN